MIKRLCCAALMAFVALSVSACTHTAPPIENTPPPVAQTAGSSGQASSDLRPITLAVGGKTFTIMLNQSDAAQALLRQLPLTLQMEELNGNEKYADLPFSLSAAPEQIGYIHRGDLMLYGDDCLVLFYEDFKTGYSYTKLGTTADPEGLAEALGPGDIRVVLDVS